MSAERLPFTPLVIIGAGRSGTNILRDTLTSLDGFRTWPCDEINPIWRHGNLFEPDDEFSPDLATPAIRRFIRGRFMAFWEASGRPRYVVEKTCANALRVPFVDAVLPEARYVHIVRDGYDVIASAQKRWQGDFELPKGSYFLAKARYTPLRDLPIYGYRFAEARLKMALGKSAHLGIWGPRFKGMSGMSDRALIDLCALQWAACVARSDAAFAQMSDTRAVQITYEDFMTHPADVVRTIVSALDPAGPAIPDAAIAAAIGGVRAPSPSKRAVIAPQLSADARQAVDAVMAAKGYGQGTA